MPSVPRQSDAELVRDTLEGNAAAYQTLVSSYQGHVYGLAYSLVGNWSDAQDIAQETFIRVHRNLRQLRDGERFAPWLRSVTFSVAMNWLRAYKPQRFEQLDGRVDLDRLSIPDFEPGPTEVVEQRELGRAVMAAIEKLPAKYRVPLTLFHLDGLSYEKVSEFLDIPLGTSKSLIHRAREKLRPLLGAYRTEEVSPMVKQVLDEHRLDDEFAQSVIRGLEHARWGAGERENSPLGALAAAFEAMGVDVSYEFLMGVSGAAFRLQMFKEKWCPSAPHPRCGFDCLGTAMAAVDYELVDLPVKQDDAAGIARVRKAVVDSIDRGVPAFYTSLEESLIVGYQDEGRRLLLRLYGTSDKGYREWWLDRDREEEPGYPESFVTDWPHLSFGVLKPRSQPADRRKAILRSLELAVELAHSEEFGPYVSGFAAYDDWVRGLRDESRFAESAARDDAMAANAHCYYSLVDARRAAHRYFEQVGDELSLATEALANAGRCYRGVAEQLAPEALAEIAPARLAPGQAWTRDQRQRQADLLERAAGAEREAVAAIEEALDALSRGQVNVGIE